MRLWQKNYSIPTHLPPVSHTGHSSNVASRATPSHSTFESDAEAPSQGVMPPPPPNSRDSKKLHYHCSPQGKVVPQKKDEAKHKERPSTKTDSTSSKRSHGGKGGKHGSSKDGATSSLKHTLDPTDSPYGRSLGLKLPLGPQVHSPACPVHQRMQLTQMSNHPSSLHPP